jgi:hypothetical protein
MTCNSQGKHRVLASWRRIRFTLKGNHPSGQKRCTVYSVSVTFSNRTTDAPEAFPLTSLPCLSRPIECKAQFSLDRPYKPWPRSLCPFWARLTSYKLRRPELRTLHGSHIGCHSRWYWGMERVATAQYGEIRNAVRSHLCNENEASRFKRARVLPQFLVPHRYKRRPEPSACPGESGCE